MQGALPIEGKATGNHPFDKLPQENYNGKDTLHSNRRRLESSTELEEED